MNSKIHYKCTKCSNTTYETGQLRAAGGFCGKIFDVQSVKMVTITCSNCGYSELFKKKTGTPEDILDFFTN